MENWFATWFDSSYYHLLYQHRDDKEAHFFMDNLYRHLSIPDGSKVLDLACGKGRHSRYLSQHNIDVTGLDLSPESINYARQFASSNLHFDTQDMRQAIKEGPYDYVLNLFTSFGYFETEEEHIQTLQRMQAALKNTSSRLVIDFFNASKSIANLVLTETKQIEQVSFHLNRYVLNGCIVKDIRFEDKGEHFHFQEKVHAFKLNDFERLLDRANLKIIDVFGSYALDTFDNTQSDRCILVAQSKS